MKLNFSLKKKFYLAFGLIFLMIFGGETISLLTYQRISQQYSHMDSDIVPGAIMITAIKSDLMELNGDLVHFVTYKTAKAEEEIAAVSKDIRELTNEHYSHEMLTEAADQASAIEIQQRCSEIILLAEDVVQLTKASQPTDRIESMLEQIHELIDDTKHVLDYHVNIHENELAETGAMLQASLKFGRWSLLISALLTVIIVFGIYYLISKAVLKPLSILQKGAACIGQGQLDHRVNISTGDETEALAGQFNIMAAALSKSHRSLENKVTKRTSALQKTNEELEKEIAQRKLTEESLHIAKLDAEEANRLKSGFLANVSHEIRTPLNAIIGFAEGNLIDNSLKNTQKQSNIILQEAETLLVLINDLLDNAKIEAGKLELEKCSFDLRQMLQRIVSSIGPRAQAEMLDFHLDIDDKVPEYVIGDALRIHQILMNLLVNALKFTEKGSITLKIETLKSKPDSCQLRFAVIDTGIGIAEDKQKTIFDSFAQADTSTTRKYGGTGLGITISRQLLELMGSHISLNSQVDKGSTFLFILDMEIALDKPKSKSANTENPDERRAEPRRKGDILVAEDYLPNQRVITMLLETAGHRVTIAEDGQKAVEAAAAHKYDLIFMDIQMPEMDGYDATREIRSSDSLCAKVPILALTANVDKETKQKCIEVGMDAVMSKPVRRKMLLATLNKWLNQNNSQEIADDHQQPECSDDKPFDFERAVEEFGGHAEVVTDLIGTFLKDAEEQIKNITDALDGNDTETVRQIAHKLRGAAGSLAAMPLSQAAEDLEELTKSGQLDNTSEKVKALEQEFTRLKKYI